MGRKFDVLVVDDRSIEAEVTLFGLRLAATPDARFLRLKDGNEALRYLFGLGEFARRSTALPDLVLLDMDMPVTSGLCVLDLIRAHEAMNGMRVIMLTADSRAHFAAQNK